MQFRHAYSASMIPEYFSETGPRLSLRVCVSSPPARRLRYYGSRDSGFIPYVIGY